MSMLGTGNGGELTPILPEDPIVVVATTLIGTKPALQSRTVVAALTMGVVILASMGVKWTVGDVTIQRIADLIVVLSALLGTPTIIAFRAQAETKIRGWFTKKV